MTPSLHFSDSCSVIAVGSTVLAFVNDSELKTISLVGTNGDCKDAAPMSAENEERRVKQTDITCASLSSCGKWFAACTGNKSLYLWATESWSVLSVRKLTRTASSMKFTPSDNAIVIADKTGDAYFYSVQNSGEEGQLLLGHLSMLLDIIVSPCEKFILTCDRDEKIRVSRFPNAYNIHTYCLGHEDFVSKIDFLPNNSKVLISGSGDGSVRFWDYMEGKQIGIVDCCNEILNQSGCEKGSETLKNTTPLKQSLAVTCFSPSQISSDVCILAVGLSSFEGCILYQISGNGASVVSVVLSILKLDIEPWDIKMRNKELWCLSSHENCPITVYIYDDASTDVSNIDSLDCKSKSLVNCFNSKWTVFKDIPPPQVATIMHKRKLDDIQEYKERKQQRLVSKSVKVHNLIT